MSIRERARVVHEANRAYCMSLGDHSQVPWDRVPRWQRESIVLGVMLLLDNPHYAAKDTHEGWLRHKLNEGWKYGKEKDAEKKIHPCCVPFAELPREQQVKDELFVAIVRVLG